MKYLHAIVVILFAAVAHAAAPAKTTIALNWVPEPEFGGIYAANLPNGTFSRQGLDVSIQPGGAGAPTWQLVASGKVPFGIASGDEIAIARARGADVVGIFTTYQTCPQGIMVHASRGFKSIADVFTTPGTTLAMEAGLPYGKFLQQKYGFEKIKRISYGGGIGNFLADKNFAQQCFVFSEPLAAKKARSDPQVFLIADAGYDPYTAVVITTDKMLRDQPNVVGGVVEALVQGWQDYLKDPKPANDAMRKLNKTMDAETFAAAADAQKPLIESKDTAANRLGWMTSQRWEELCQQLSDLKIVDKPVPAKECFHNVTGSAAR